MVDIVASFERSLEITYFDTHFLFPETHDLRRRLQARYPHLHFVNRGTTLTPEEQAQRLGPELWARDPERCCDLRKVEPMRRAVAGRRAWMTALRRTQSATRAAVQAVEHDARFDVIKINPLASWSREEVWDWVRAHDVPFNTLHEQGYPSIGCTHCTSPVDGAAPWNYTRAGRWAGLEKTECGLHLSQPPTAAGVEVHVSATPGRAAPPETTEAGERSGASHG